MGTGQDRPNEAAATARATARRRLHALLVRSEPKREIVKRLADGLHNR